MPVVQLTADGEFDVSGAQQRFRTALVGIEEEIVARNRRRCRPYRYLRPAQIPNSTNI
ncbi:hypothetical protein KALB_3310 [Kutzneria albida DSM 43870]|uniref:Lipoxygenase domain-containing protein n=1 Tax=Kutzneria albida DSM 43870 TaxID=1449976 RepID=W5W724_9PSEU|nr:hypothetical protein KALB_3310 [Kutzneria albida DSM 43870]